MAVLDEAGSGPGACRSAGLVGGRPVAGAAWFAPVVLTTLQASSRFPGHLATGVAHAPLLYAEDPRTDLPSQLATRVGGVIDGLDPTIVRGWLEAADRG